MLTFFGLPTLSLMSSFGPSANVKNFHNTLVNIANTKGYNIFSKFMTKTPLTNPIKCFYTTIKTVFIVFLICLTVPNEQFFEKMLIELAGQLSNFFIKLLNPLYKVKVTNKTKELKN